MKINVIGTGYDPVATNDSRRIFGDDLRPIYAESPMVALMRCISKLVGKSAAVDRLTQSLVIDSSKIRNELGWQPPC